MLVEVLTPFMLATAPATLPEPPKAQYSHEQQRSILIEGSKDKLIAYGTISWNGTQTFGYNGKPNDADNDND